MCHFSNHALYSTSSFFIYWIVHFFNAQSNKRLLLSFGSFNAAFYLCDSNLCHFAKYYPLKTLSTEIPRVRATVIGSRIFIKASKVAFTTLCGLEEPLDFRSEERRVGKECR